MIKKLLRARSWIDVIKHVMIAGVLFALLLVIVFYIYLPIKTKQDNSITVPDVVGMEFDGLHDFITSKELNYVILSDSGYNADLPPQAVLSQFPQESSRVKQGRKIYLTLNAVEPPKVEMPDLVGKSLKTVQLQLQAMGVKEGKYIFTPGPYKNTFVSAQQNGQDIAPGTFISKGSTLDLILQNGKGQQYFEAPDVIGRSQENAELVISGSSLKIGEIYYHVADSMQGRVIKQIPQPGSRVRIGQKFDLWISVADTSSVTDAALNQDND